MREMFCDLEHNLSWPCFAMQAVNDVDYAAAGAAAATKLPGAVESSSGSMLLLATLEDTFQGFYRA